MTAGQPFCAECGWTNSAELEDCGGVIYCNECLSWLSDLADKDAMPGEQDRRVLVDDDDESPSGTQDQFVACPDCFDTFLVTDMIEEHGELICNACKKVADGLGMHRGNFGTTWRSND